MSTKTNISRLSNAPLVLTLAALEFAPVDNIREYIPELQDRLRRKYPERKEVKRKEINFNASDHTTTTKDSLTWSFLSADRSWVVTINENSLVLATSKNYEGFSNFKDRFKEAVEFLQDVLKVDYFRRLGFRQIDNVFPDPDLEEQNRLSIEGLLEENFKNPARLRVGKVDADIIEVSVNTEVGRLVARLYRRNMECNVPSVPNDLAGYIEQFSPPFSIKKVSELVILDIDNFKGSPEGELLSLNVDELITDLQELKAGSISVFCEVVTDEALAKWE
jgi:uncharacterized protein (TIGR04255 family)